MPSYSVATTSALTEAPSQLRISQIFKMCSLKSTLPSLAMSDGLVVTPSRMPRLSASRISFRFAVSTKNFIRILLVIQQNVRGRTLLQSFHLTYPPVHKPKGNYRDQCYPGDDQQRQAQSSPRRVGLNFKREKIGALDLQSVRRRASRHDINGVDARLFRDPHGALFIAATCEIDLFGAAVGAADQSLDRRAGHRAPG